MCKLLYQICRKNELKAEQVHSNASSIVGEVPTYGPYQMCTNEFHKKVHETNERDAKEED